MKNNPSSNRSFNKASVIIALSVILGTVTYAWTGPTGTAPTNNVAAPINVNDNEQIKGGPVIFNGSFNPTRLSSGWTGYTLNGAGGFINRAEISNDTGTYKALMIAGNKSGDGINRKIKLYDNVEVNGNLSAGSVGVTGALIANSISASSLQISGVSSLGKIQISDTVTENTACTSNGLVAKDSAGSILTCQSLLWKKPAAAASAVTLRQAGCYWNVVAACAVTCPAGYYVAGVQTGRYAGCGVQTLSVVPYCCVP